MIKNLILVAALFFLISCRKSLEKSALPILNDLLIIDSTKVEDGEYFLNGQFHIQLIGDSLIGVSSYKTPSIGFYHISGEQRKRIASGDFPIGSFLPSYFDVSEYPIAYLLDKKSQSILIFNVERQEFIKKIKLQVPENKEIKIIGSCFKKLKNGFLVELATSLHDELHPEYYKKSGKLIYQFSENGEVLNNPFLEYPNQITAIEGSLKPIEYLSFSSDGSSLLFTFPHEKKITRIDTYNFGEILEEIPLPPSRYFNYNLIGAQGILNFQDTPSQERRSQITIPDNHYFTKILESGSKIIIQTWLIGDESKGMNRTTHLMLYDRASNEWSETSNPRNILDIGMLAGVVNDTLYFYEGSLMKSDEKYIKRAVLRPIENKLIFNFSKVQNFGKALLQKPKKSNPCELDFLLVLGDL